MKKLFIEKETLIGTDFSQSDWAMLKEEPWIVQKMREKLLENRRWSFRALNQK